MTGFDCSGFIQEVFASIGMSSKEDLTAQGLYNYFLPLGYGSLQDEGSVLFFGESVSQISHIALALNKEQMIEAGGGTSKTVDLPSAVSQKAFVRIRPISRRKDLVATIMPKYSEWVWRGKT